MDCAHKCLQPALIYGLPKMHKIKSSTEIPPFRPIISSVNTYNYRLATYLCTLLQPHLPTTYTIPDTFSFVQELGTMNLSNKFMVSFDVASLFTNIPSRTLLISQFLILQKETLVSGSPNLNLLNYFQLLLRKPIFFLMERCLTK